MKLTLNATFRPIVIKLALVEIFDLRRAFTDGACIDGLQHERFPSKHLSAVASSLWLPAKSQPVDILISSKHELDEFVAFLLVPNVHAFEVAKSLAAALIDIEPYSSLLSLNSIS